MHQNVLKRSTNSLVFMNVISLHSDHQHVSATYVAIFRMVTTRMHICVEITVEWFRHILFVFLLLPPWRWPHESPKHVCVHYIMTLRS